MTQGELAQHMEHDRERFEALNDRLDKIEATLAAAAQGREVILATLNSYKGFFAGIVFICVALAGAVGMAVGVLK